MATPVAPSPIPSWLQEPTIWNTVRLGGLVLPGLCRVKIKPARRVDKPMASGRKGAAIVDKGAALAKVTIAWVFWSDAQWDEVQNVVNAIFPLGGKVQPQPLDIVHPKAALFDVKSIYIEDIDTDDPDDDGICRWTINAHEYAAQKTEPVAKKTKSAGDAAGWAGGTDYLKGAGDTLDDAVDVFKRRLEARGIKPPTLPSTSSAPRRTSAPRQQGARGAGGAGGNQGAGGAGGGG